MLHGGVAGGHNFIHLVRLHLPFLQELGDEAVQRAEDDLVQLGQAVLVEHGVADAGDYVGSLCCLAVEGGADCDRRATVEIDQHAHDGSRANIKGQAK